MEVLHRTLENAPVITRNEYEYFVHPVTDGIPLVEADLLREIVDGILKLTTIDTVDVIVTPESMGIHHATALTLETGVPFTVVRKRPYNFEDEVAVEQRTAYSEQKLYINNVHTGDRVLVLDDVCSTGGTLTAICSGLLDVGAEIVDVIVVIQRKNDQRAILPVEVKSLVNVEITDGRVVVHP
ncbi:hypoxanthine/guanine phosphoribosyltransferase [Haladaptatus caseinilyticus]|uniref:hypoxanthine/guanine phosphoribosyltransferase n=1 Tax=Haladaptatus caseinilyticus TaxID=2993314 RepID=UPI00224B64B6|nr:hypoxanthine/guanine phosphoribosyltransferase [Haladaptatus caseinilyticus]